MPQRAHADGTIAGNHGNLEVVLYNQNSIYGSVNALRYAPSEEAANVATNELLMLTGLAPSVFQSEGVEVENANASATI